MAEHAENSKRDYDEAIRQYKEALQIYPEDEVRMVVFFIVSVTKDLLYCAGTSLKVSWISFYLPPNLTLM